MQLIDKIKIGFIGTGWVGSAYAKNFKQRGYDIVQYSIEPEFVDNKEKIKDCDIVIVAVPTPTNDNGADYTILRSVLQLIGKGKIAVIKSTILPGTTDELQKENPDIIIFHSPEFLSIATADRDASYPPRHILGIPEHNAYDDSRDYIEAITQVIDVFPHSPYTQTVSAKEAELIKYAHNCGGVINIIWHNLLYNVCEKFNLDWGVIKDAIKNDPDNIVSYLNPVNKGGRGAGGVCFIKDFAAFAQFYEENINDEFGSETLKGIEAKNVELLVTSKKDLEILKAVYVNFDELQQIIND